LLPDSCRVLLTDYQLVHCVIPHYKLLELFLTFTLDCGWSTDPYIKGTGKLQT
jgi:hypothetical protein